MAVINNAPIPVSDPIAKARDPKTPRDRKDPNEGRVTKAWIDWFTNLFSVQAQTPTRVAATSVSAQSASIGATDLSDGTLSAGLYRISFYARITQPGTVSSSLTIAFDWTDATVSVPFTETAITGNTTTTIQTDTLLIEIDANSPVRYSTTYASVGATAMTYKLAVTLEEILA